MISSEAIHLGPFMLPFPLLLVLFGLLIVYAVGKILEKKQQWSVQTWRTFSDSLWTMLWVGLVAARLVFVLLNLDVYLASPIDIIKVQDKGFHLYGGVIAGVAWFLWKNRTFKLENKVIFVTIFTLICALSLGLSQWQKPQSFYPNMQFNNLEQQQISLKQFVGKPTVVNLWASWCPPCHREMPVLAQAQNDFKQVNFVMLNQGEGVEKVQAYLSKNQFSFHNVLFDTQGELAKEMKMFGLPSTLFFNAQGQLVDRHMGELSPAMLQQYLKKISSSDHLK
ncbi:TlpA family protein disulfide reductase [Acinetobacter defluvii]|uniref:TlpA family protein disulfide reductase n=1 Tax=Acinetobacter defluvii TaxID=1871111 RepID=A0A2S2FEG5_9GAMM|nr:TlpA disulfide reductase family protein [Acinetobacter defluvii]AWL28712.1 TlpA family protein disulfide reductase [Acinetobacter defluvii]